VALAGGFALLKAQGDQLLSVQTGSMVPNIRRGYLVAVEKVSTDQLQVGDVITYKSELSSLKGATITHRIIELPNAQNGQKIIVKGDANPSADEPFSPDRIVGRVHKAVPYAGFVMDFLSTPIGLLSIIYLPALFIVLDEIKRLSKHYEGQKPWKDITHSRFRTPNLPVLFAFVFAGLLIYHSGATFARLQSSVKLTGNTIKVKQTVTPPPPPPPTCHNSNSTNVSINNGGTGGGSSNNTNININNSTTQTATSGNATSSGNTHGGSATSGNAYNCNSTSINIQIH